MKVLGIWDGHDAGAAVVENGRVLAAVNEERLSRRKLEVGFPRRSIRVCLDLARVAPSALDRVAVSTSDPAKTLTRLFPTLREEYYLLRRRKKDPGSFAPLKKRFKYRFTELPPTSLSRRLSRGILEKQLRAAGIAAPLTLVDHHAGHAWAAATTCGFDHCAVITLDGVGDGCSGSLWQWRDYILTRLASLPARVSLGIFFEHVTNLMNMRELEDEGKVMALANFAFPVPSDQNPLLHLLRVNGFALESSWDSRSLYRELARIFWRTPAEQFAWMAQQALEKWGMELVAGGMAMAGSSRLAVAGGLFANVKLNMRLAAMEQVESIAVFPHMGDGGLAVGSALALDPPGPGKVAFNAPLLGPAAPEHEMLARLRERSLHWQRLENVEKSAADLLLSGVLLLWFQGPMEYGPRSLGCRSILARPDDPRVKDQLNLVQKKRVWYQPFCPSILLEDATGLLEVEGRGDLQHNRFMTTAFRVRDRYHGLMQAVTNVDHTCRPHLVGEENPPFRALLLEMKKELGHGVVLNTSCNIHGEPMVCSVNDMLEMFVRTPITHLIMGPFLVTRGDG